MSEITEDREKDKTDNLGKFVSTAMMVLDDRRAYALSHCGYALWCDLMMNLPDDFVGDDDDDGLIFGLDDIFDTIGDGMGFERLNAAIAELIGFGIAKKIPGGGLLVRLPLDLESQ